MSRDDGFPIADMDTGYLDDPKVRNLWRILGDQGRMTHALALHMATLLASWGSGSRVTVAEAAPLWLTPDPELVAALATARLLDGSGRLPARSWKAWHDPASARREAARERWRRANDKRKRGDDAVATRLPRGKNDVPLPPVRQDRSVRTVPTEPSSPRAAARSETAQGANGTRNGLTPLADLLPDAYASLGPKP
jgi:hypothetical protein